MSGSSQQTFGEVLRLARLKVGLTQEALAEQAGISTRAVSDLERGINRAPQMDTLRMLGNALELTPEELRQWQTMRRQLASRGMHNARWSASQNTYRNHTVPVPLDSFVGRERDEASIIDMLGNTSVRVLTLTGPGGVGKTRLAAAVARSLEGQFPDGTWFVNLAPVNDPDIVFTTIASTLGIHVSGQEPALSALIDGLRNARSMLILDNFEQVVMAAPQVAEFVVACPAIRIIATSRVPLRIQGEREYPVAPLAVPDDCARLDPGGLRQVEATRLFEQRAQAINISFELDESNADAVAAICRRLDGLPLAIELAAARTRLLPAQALLKRLERRLPLLSATTQDVPKRHQTLRDTIAWSYELLDPAEQSLFRALSIFRGGWALEAAQHMQGNPHEALTLLETLVSHNLVRVREMQDGEARYSMLETIAEFAQDVLDERDEANGRYQQHIDYYLALTEQAERHFRGTEQDTWMDLLEHEHANVHAALRRSRERAQQGDRQAIVSGLRIAGAVWWFWYVRGHFREARRQITLLVEQYRELRAADAALARQPEAEIAYATSLFVLSSLEFWAGDFTWYEHLMAESRAIYEQWGRGRELATLIVFSGFGAGDAGRFDEAETLLEQAISAFQGLEDAGGEALAHLGMGETNLRQGQHEPARDSLAASLELFSSINDVRGVAAANALTGMLFIRAGRLTEARELLAASIRSRVEIGDKGGIAWCLERMADLALHETLPPDRPAMRAARLLGAAGALRNAIASPVVPVDQPEIERITSTARAQLSDPAFVAAWEAGRTMPLEDAVSYALDPGCRPPDPATTNR